MTFFADSIKDKPLLKVEEFFTSSNGDLLKSHNYLYYCYFRDIVDFLFPSLSEKIVCDVGCGSGIWSLALFNKARKIFLLDNNEMYLRIAKKLSSLMNIQILF